MHERVNVPGRSVISNSETSSEKVYGFGLRVLTLSSEIGYAECISCMSFFRKKSYWSYGWNTVAM